MQTFLVQGPSYKDRHKGGVFAYATQCNVSHQKQEDSPKRDRDSVGMGLAYTFYANNSGRRTVLTGGLLPEAMLNKLDHRHYSRNLPDHAAQEDILE